MDGGFESFEVEEIRDKRITKRGAKSWGILFQTYLRNDGVFNQMEGVPRARKDLGATRESSMLFYDLRIRRGSFEERDNKIQETKEPRG